MGLNNAPTTLTPHVMQPSCQDDLSKTRKNGIAYEGLLKYESKHGTWKERWFVLDDTENRLIKCYSSADQRATTHNSVLGRSTRDIRIADIRGLSAKGISADAGLEVMTSTGKHLRFLTRTHDDEQQWLVAAHKLTHGFTRGVADRLAERELLAGKYALVRELGRGASGVVSLYTHQGKPFAVKKFVPPKAKGIPNRLTIPSARQTKANGVPEDVRREIALLKKASHLPHVIKLYDVIANIEEQQFYLVMEYMGGGAIAEWDAERKCYASARHQKSLSLLDEKTVRVYMTNVLLGVQALHQNGLCHRDIKPENIMANDEHTLCKIGDLGIAHFFRPEADGELVEEADPDSIALWDITQQRAATVPSRSDPPPQPLPRRAMLKSTKGTYQFLPPEALSGDAFDGFQADIWSIGVTLYALLFGYLPFFSPDLVTLFEKIERDPVVFPTTCHDEEIQDLLLGILEKDPAKRLSIDQILAHRWMHRHVDSKALTNQVQKLKRAPRLRVEAHELGDAVSVLQSRFQQLRSAVQDQSLDALRDASDSEAADAGVDTPQNEDTLYVPHPIVTTGVELRPWMQSDLPVLATQLHFDWCRAKHLDGWVYGANRDDNARIHPLLVPMRYLPNDAQLQNVQAADETLKCVLALGCHVDKIETVRSNKRCPVGPANLVPADHIVLTWDLLLIVDLLAENAHEVWAANAVQQGWRTGATFDAETKTHPSLRPYMALDEIDKKLCREGVGAVLKSCVCLGYTFSCARDKPAPRRSSMAVWAV